MSMDRFNGKVALITGAAQGIGRATAVRIASEGGSIAAVDLNADGLSSLVEELRGMGVEAEAFSCDVGDPTQVETTIAGVVERFGKLDVLCNVAGILRTSHSHEADLDTWNKIIQVNLTGTFLMCRAAIPHLLAAKGSIVNTSSTAALGSHPWMAAYAASKGGVLALTKSLAAEYVKQKLNVNAVVPGGIMTPIHGSFALPDGADFALIAGAQPKVAMAGPEYAASAIAFLASSDARYMNGTQLLVDGGALN